MKILKEERINPLYELQKEVISLKSKVFILEVCLTVLYVGVFTMLWGIL